MKGRHALLRMRLRSPQRTRVWCLTFTKLFRFSSSVNKECKKFEPIFWKKSSFGPYTLRNKFPFSTVHTQYLIQPGYQKASFRNITCFNLMTIIIRFQPAERLPQIEETAAMFYCTCGIVQDPNEQCISYKRKVTVICSVLQLFKAIELHLKALR